MPPMFCRISSNTVAPRHAPKKASQIARVESRSWKTLKLVYMNRLPKPNQPATMNHPICRPRIVKA